MLYGKDAVINLSLTCSHELLTRARTGYGTQRHRVVPVLNYTPRNEDGCGKGGITPGSLETSALHAGVVSLT
jgi:hypothetical protein